MIFFGFRRNLKKELLKKNNLKTQMKIKKRKISIKKHLKN